jgi:hypothetical protein
MSRKPTTFADITPVDGVLVGTEPDGTTWTIRWCGNGPYSHWVLSLVSDPDEGWYVYKYPEHREAELKGQIEAAEHKYKIY